MRWYLCPYCGKKLFPYDERSAHADGISMKCKGRGCGKIVHVKIQAPVTNIRQAKIS